MLILNFPRLIQNSQQLPLFRTYGIVSIARHIETGMYVAIKKFKESDDNEYVSITYGALTNVFR